MSADFPKFSLEQTLAVPNALQRNGGMPMTVIDVATAIDRSPGSSTTRQLGFASSAYGLTTGSYKTKFTMDALGRSIVEPKSTEEKTASLVAAALHPASFKSVFEALKGKKLPEAQFFANTLVRDFDVDPKQSAAYVEIFIKNLRYVGLIKNTPGGEWISSDGVSSEPVKDAVDGTPPGKVVGMVLGQNNPTAYVMLIDMTPIAQGINTLNDKPVTFNMYPNPAQDVVKFDISNLNSTNGSSEIYNAMGQMVITAAIAGAKTEMNITGLNGGVYIARVVAENKNVVYKKLTIE